MAHRVTIVAVMTAATLLATGCGGSQSVQLTADDPNHAGAVAFAKKCGACHTFSLAGTQGSTYDVSERENVDGPNFDDRKENVSDVLYAIRNGGFSGAIMPENIATGDEAQAIAEFLAKYAGKSGAGAGGG